MLRTTKELLNQFEKDINKLGGIVDYIYSNDQFSDTKLIMVSTHLSKPATDENCVASIDWGPDDRYNGKQIFDVNTYNENFKLDAKTRQKAFKLQDMTVKYSQKFWENENF